MNSAAVNIGSLVAFSSAGLETILAARAAPVPPPAAEEQGRITWVREHIGAALNRLYEAEPTRHLIVEMSKAVVTELHTLRGLMESSTRDRAALGRDPDALVGAELETLRGYVEPGAASAADWVWHGALHPWQTWTGTGTSPWAAAAAHEVPAVELHTAWRAAEETARPIFLDTPEAGLLRSQCLLLAAFEGARRRLDVARAAELAYLSFDHACEAVDALAAHGIRLADHVVQADEERVRRTIRSADALRLALAERDLEAMRAARLVSLR